MKVTPIGVGPQLTPEQQLTSGVTPGLVRLSVGLENVADLKADLEVLVTRMNVVPSKANLARVKAVRAEIAAVAEGR